MTVLVLRGWGNYFCMLSPWAIGLIWFFGLEKIICGPLHRKFPTTPFRRVTPKISTAPIYPISSTGGKEIRFWIGDLRAPMSSYEHLVQMKIIRFWQICTESRLAFQACRRSTTGTMYPVLVVRIRPSDAFDELSSNLRIFFEFSTFFLFFHFRLTFSPDYSGSAVILLAFRSFRTPASSSHTSVVSMTHFKISIHLFFGLSLPLFRSTRTFFTASASSLREKMPNHPKLFSFILSTIRAGPLPPLTDTRLVLSYLVVPLTRIYLLSSLRHAVTFFFRFFFVIIFFSRWF